MLAGLRWPQRPLPHPATLHRWLQRAVERRMVLQDGGGTRGDPFRYWLPGRKVEWNPDPLETLGLLRRF